MDVPKTFDELPGKCCLRCQFLGNHRGDLGALLNRAGARAPSGNYTWPVDAFSTEGRTNILDAIRNGTPMKLNYYGCGKGVHGFHSGLNSDVNQALIRDRGEECFFLRAVEGMTFEAANELERRAADRREAEHDRALTRQSLDHARRAYKWSIVSFFILVAATIIAAFIQSCGNQ